MNDKQLFLYPVWVRIWHGVNALCIIVLIISGLSMQYSSIDNSFIRFAVAVKMHNISGIITLFSYLIFVVGNIVTGNGKHYRQELKGMMSRLIIQGTYYVDGYFKGEPKPFIVTEKKKFNPLQHIAYAFAMYLFLPMVIVSGIALLYPEMIVNQIFNWSGIQVTAFVHVLFGTLIFVFLLVHLYVASIGKHPLKNYKSIVNGMHDA